MSDTPTRPEFELLKEMIENGFDGVHSRLDKLNGKTDDHSDRITTLEASQDKVSWSTILSVLAIVVTLLGLFHSGGSSAAKASGDPPGTGQPSR